MGKDDEYTVETILRARVTTKTPRSKQLVWKYHVKWKGYDDPDDNTWEPTESFSGSEHFIESFWKKVDTGERDVRNLKLFKEGEELSPSGNLKSPLCKSKKVNETNEHDFSSTRSGKRKRDQREPVETTPPAKRATGRISRNSRKSRHGQTLESHSDPPPEVETEEEDRLSLSENGSNSEGNVTPIDERSPRYRNRMDLTPSPEPQSQPAAQMSPPDTPTTETLPSTSYKVPAHRARAANPLVKMMDEDINMEGAISTKARLFAQRGRQPSASGEALGHNLPSGGEPSVTPAFCYSPVLGSSVKSIVGAKSEGYQDQHADGQNDDAEGLEDYEEENDNTESCTTVSDLRGNNRSESIFQQSLALAKDTLFSATLSNASQSIGSAISAAWKRSTIFSPLASGSYQPQPTILSAGGHSPSQKFILNLEVTVSLPVVFLSPATSSNSEEPELVVSNNSNNPPGKFYNKEAALSVLGTLRTGRPYAIVTYDPHCNETQKGIFHQFSERLAKDELFLAMAGTDVLAFCSSASPLIFQRLNFPPSSGYSPSIVSVKQVTIQDHSAYANAVLQA